MKPCIGHNLSKTIELNLLPGVHMPKGYWTVQIRYGIDEVHSAFHGDTFNCDGKNNNFNIIVGSDVHSITFKVHRHNSYPGKPNTFILYTLRVDQILMLNLIYKLADIKFEVEEELC